MLIIFRAWYFVGIAALVCAVIGGRELSLALEAATEPEAISLHDLEQDKRPSQPFVSISDFYAEYPSASYELKHERVKDAMYPIVSMQHPWVVAWDNLQANYENLDDVPAGQIPAFEPIKVLALTDSFDKVADIPDEGRQETGLMGILFAYEDLNRDEKDLVALIVKHNPEQVVVIEVGRRPKSVMFGVVVSSVGCILGLLAISLFFRNRRVEADEKERELVDPEFDDAGRPGLGGQPPELPGSQDRR